MATTIVVRVGGPTEQRKFTILQSIATKSSKFMQTTFGGEWRESREKSVSLPETKVADFEVYLEWLYTGHVVTLDSIKALGATLIRLYVLGDFLVDDRFCNTVMDTLILESQRGYPRLAFSPADIDSAWEKTMPGSGLRKVLVDLVIRDMSGDGLSPRFWAKGIWCHEVTAEVFARMAESKQIAVEMFAGLTGQVKLCQGAKSAVCHPKHIKNICADYRKHGEDYPRCS